MEYRRIVLSLILTSDIGIIIINLRNEISTDSII